MKYIIVYGSLSEGFTFHGPFDTFDDADEHSRTLGSHPTWIAELQEHYDPDKHLHTRTSPNTWWEYDARGIPIARVCEQCRPHKLKGYRPEVLTDPNYEHDEPIEEE